MIKKTIAMLALVGTNLLISTPASAEPAKKGGVTNTTIKCLQGQQKLYVAFTHSEGSGSQVMCTSLDLQETEAGLFMIRKKIEEIAKTQIVIISIMKLRA